MLNELCMIVCIVIMLISRCIFSEVFSRPLWKYLMLLVFGSYALLFFKEAISLTTFAFFMEGDLSNDGCGEELTLGFGIWKLLLLPLQAMITVCYIISFLRRIRKKVKGDKNNKNEEEASCSM